MQNAKSARSDSVPSRTTPLMSPEINTIINETVPSDNAVNKVGTVHHLDFFFAAVDSLDFVGAVVQIDLHRPPVIPAGIFSDNFNAVAA